MYAGVGKMTGEPGREKRVMAISSALITSGTWWTSRGVDGPAVPAAQNSAQAVASWSARTGDR